MADVLHFDVDEALDAMLDVFWQRGFKLTTTKELAIATNLSEGSLFNAFGNKQEIYRRVLQRYIDRHKHLLDLLERSDSPLGGLRAYWEKIAARAVDKTHTNGCMITNAAIEHSGDTDIAAFIRATHKRSERAFKAVLDKAVTLGELQPDTDTEAIAQFLLHSTQGIRVLSRLSPSRKKMKNIVDGVMSVVDQHRLAS